MDRSELIDLIKKDFRLIDGTYDGISKWIAFNPETNQISLFLTDRNCFNITGQTFLIVLNSVVDMCGSLGYNYIANALFYEYMQSAYYVDVEESPYIFDRSRFYYNETDSERLYYVVSTYYKDGKSYDYSYYVGSLTWFTNSDGSRGSLFGSFNGLFELYRNLYTTLSSAVRPDINDTQYSERQFESAIIYFINNLSKFVKYSTSSNPDLHHYENVRSFIRWVHTQDSVNCCLLECFVTN